MIRKGIHRHTSFEHFSFPILFSTFRRFSFTDWSSCSLSSDMGYKTQQRNGREADRPYSTSTGAILQYMKNDHYHVVVVRHDVILHARQRL